MLFILYLSLSPVHPLPPFIRCSCTSTFVFKGPPGPTGVRSPCTEPQRVCSNCLAHRRLRRPSVSPNGMINKEMCLVSPGKRRLTVDVQLCVLLPLNKSSLHKHNGSTSACVICCYILVVRCISN